jgi:hypothetical protein
MSLCADSGNRHGVASSSAPRVNPMHSSKIQDMKQKAQWRCPKCGHRFVVQNLWHSCGNYSIKRHFKGKPVSLRNTFNRFVSAARKFGPVTVYAQKSRIVLQARVRFAGVTVRKYWIDAHIWLRRRVDHPLLTRIESLGRLGYACHFRLRDAADIDDRIVSFLSEGYRLQE